MRLFKFFSLVAVGVLAVTYLKADEAPEPEIVPSNALQEEEIGLNNEPITYHSAADERADTNTEEMPPYDQGYSIEEDQMMSAYNAPARIDVTGSWDVSIRASYIYWLAKLKGMEYAITRPADFNTTNEAIDYTYKLHDVDQNYKSGFKIALATNLAHDNWTALVKYVRLHGDNHSSTVQSTGDYTTYPERLISLWMDSHLEHNTLDTASSQGQFTKLTGKLKSKYDMLNMEFARPFYEGTCLTFRPHMGLTGGWIKQSFTTVGTILTDTFTLQAKSHSNSWLIGPRFGVDGNWILDYGFAIEGDIAGTLAYQSIKVNYKQRSDSFTTHYSRLFNYKKFTQITPVLEGNIGMNWGTYFADNGWHFSLHTLYEFLYYFDQNYMRKVSGQILDSTVLSSVGTAGTVNSRSNSKPEDLLIHGLTITARLDF